MLGQLDVGEEVYRHSILKEVVGELADLLITIEALDEACLVDVLCLEEVCTQADTCSLFGEVIVQPEDSLQRLDRKHRCAIAESPLGVVQGTREHKLSRSLELW